MAEGEPTTRVIFIRNCESNPDSGGARGLDYLLTDEGHAQAQRVGTHLLDIVKGGNSEPPVLRVVHDGSARSRATLTVAAGMAGFPGIMHEENVLRSDGEVDMSVLRDRVNEWLQNERNKIDAATELLSGFDNGWSVQRALNGLYIVAAVSHKTVSSVVAPLLGIADDKIGSEHPLDGRLTNPHPYIPFGSITELELSEGGTTLVHAGITPEDAALWARTTTNPPVGRKLVNFGAPPDDTAYSGRRYSGGKLKSAP